MKRFTLNNSKNGFEVKYNKLHLLTLIHLSLTKEDEMMEDLLLKEYAKAMYEFLSSIFNFNHRIANKNILDMAPHFTKEDFPEFNQKYLYKYVNDSTVEYYKKGSFQIGNTGYYQIMENEKARDEFEGVSFIVARTGKRMVPLTISMGNNYNVFCLTNQDSDSLNPYHVENFGSKLLKIEIGPFAKLMADCIGAKSYKIVNVRYANAKLLMTKVPFIITPQNLSNLRSNEVERLLQHVIDELTIPTLSIKNGWFKPERETRILFEMPNNVDSTKPLRFENSELLNYITFL